MSVWSNVSRRGLLRLALQTFLLGRAAGWPTVQARSLDVDRIATRNLAGAHALYFRRYRVHVTISLLSIPLFSRDNVGAACVMVEERAAATGCTSAIQLSGGSWPDRAKGFNRFGMTQEVARHEDGALMESAYLSFMTSSPEKNADQAWQAFADRSRALTLAVARGTATPGAYASELEHLTAPEGSTWMDCPRMMATLRNAAASRQSAAASQKTERAYPTFLHAVRAAIMAESGGSQCTFMHNANLYDLHTALGDSAGSKLLTGRVIEPAAKSGSRGESYFKLWFRSRDASGLPSKIEFRPRSFLRLVFEEDANAGGPALPCLIPQEGA